MKLGVIGGGAWGTALAQVAAQGRRETLLWALEEDVVAAVNRIHENPVYLKGLKLEPAIRATGNFSELKDCDAWLVVTPAQHMRAVLARMPCPGIPLVLCSKGIEESSGALLHEVARGLPTAVTLAGDDIALAEQLRDRLAQPTFRIYVSDDPAGAEIGGAVKNVLAIACGVVEGKGLGQNARAALIARGFAEMRRFGFAYGAKSETLAGLSGLGDLVLTCSSTSSRNYSLGKGIGEGRSAAELLADRTTVAEGAFTAPVLARLAKQKAIDMPIVDAVDALIAGRADVDEVLEALLTRPSKSEAT